MDPREIVRGYYDAWRGRAGDMTGVALAEDFAFRGPVASFDSAEGFRAMARQAGPAVRGFQVRRQFCDGDVVCSIIDWRMEPIEGTLTAAELLTVRDGRIVEGELIYDAEDLRRVMAGAPQPGDVVGLLERGYLSTADVLAGITAGGFSSMSPCAKWTVRQVGNHLVGALGLLTRVAEGETVPGVEFDEQVTADADHLGSDPVGAFRAVARRCTAAFSVPGALEAMFPFVGGAMAPGVVLANISLMETLVHGWDLARGAGVPYPVDDEVVDAVWAFARQAIGEDNRQAGQFGPARPTEPDAPAFVALLGHLGREA